MFFHQFVSNELEFYESKKIFVPPFIFIFIELLCFYLKVFGITQTNGINYNPIFFLNFT